MSNNYRSNRKQSVQNPEKKPEPRYVRKLKRKTPVNYEEKRWIRIFNPRTSVSEIEIDEYADQELESMYVYAVTRMRELAEKEDNLDYLQVLARRVSQESREKAEHYRTMGLEDEAQEYDRVARRCAQQHKDAIAELNTVRDWAARAMNIRMMASDELCERAIAEQTKSKKK